MSQQEFAKKLDLANHHANSTSVDIQNLCRDVLAHGFNAAFVNPTYIEVAKAALAGKAKVGTAFSFPIGQDSLESKIFAAKDAIAHGADELDIVPNNGLLLAGDIPNYSRQIETIVSAARKERSDIIVKFIIETGYFIKDYSVSQELIAQGTKQINEAAQAIANGGADFVKICSGMGPRGAHVKDVKIIRAAIGDKVRIKVAGGINTLQEASELFLAGADRIGTSSAVKIIEEFQSTFHS